MAGTSIAAAALALLSCSPEPRSAATASPATAVIAFVQVASADPQAPQTAVAVTYGAAQTTGDLNVVVVGWNDTTATVTSVTDTSGNAYARAVGPTASAGALSQAIYYAKNIATAAPGANTVTVNFSTAAQYPDIRILEYSGIDPTNPVDVVAAATGSSTTSDSGPATTTNASDLIFGANMVQTITTGPGTGFTSRVITPSDGDIAEDQVVTTTGTYRATAPLSPAGKWVMQMVAFRAATTGPDTQAPTAPTNLAATAATSSQINLTWTASTDNVGVTGYLVERCQGVGCSSFAQVGTAVGTSYGDNGLVTGASYSYRVRATDAAGNLSGYSNVTSATTPAPDTQAPTPPTNLVASAASSSQVNLTWTASTDNVGVTGYLVERCQGAGCTTFAQVGTTAGTSYGDTGLLANTSYSYRVRATDAAGNLSGYSNVVGATTLAPPPAAIAFVQVASADPQAPQTTVAVTYGAAQRAGDLNVVVVGWNDTIATVTSVTDSSGNPYTRALGPTAMAATLSQSIYYAKNIAAAAAGANTVTVRFGTAAQYPDIRILEYGGIDPTNPVDVVAAGSGNGTTSDSGAATTNNANDLIFGANMVQTFTTGPGTGFTSRVITSPDGDIAEDRVVTTAGSYRATAPLSPAGKWVMQMVAFRGAPSTPDAQAPTAPTNLVATAATSSQVNLTWTASTDNVGVTGYLVERCQGAGCSTFGQVGTATGTSYGDNGLLAGTSYSYRVRATDAAGNLSGYSNVASATTPAPDTQPPTAPGALAATAASSSQINLTWAASTDNVGVTGYLVEQCQGAGCSTFAQVGTAMGTSYGDTGLLAGTSYSYRVRATDAAGNLSGYSNVASATTLAPPPAAAIAFVQVASADPQAPQTAVAVTYGAAQRAGDLNVVVVGWNDTTATVTSVTDTSGNAYALAVGPTAVSGALSQSIYYAKNIAAAAAGANTVRVNFSTAAQYPDIRILEYGGIDPTNPVDVVAAATGNSNTSDSGPATTTNASDLIFGANMVQTITTGPGTGFTSRVITSPDGDIAEDQVVTTAGTYRSTAPLSSAGKWVMQMVAFRGVPFFVSPRSAAITPRQTQQFTASVGGVTWSVNGIVGGSASVGTITPAGLYTPPAAVGAFTIQATPATPAQSASATVYVTDYAGKFTFHDDNLRTGRNLNETVLTPTNVNAGQFGLLFSYPLDGKPQASPLYVANVNIPGLGYRNVVYVATEHDSVYAFDADGLSSTPLWKVSFINPAAGITTVSPADTGEPLDIYPEIGITSTPVIDPVTSTLYLVAKTKEVSGATTSFVQRLHALDIASGAEKLGGPVVLQASVPGTGDGNDGFGQVPFDSLRENQRPALLLSNGVLYIAFAAHGDIGPYHGWVLAYDAATLSQVFAFNNTPNASGGGIWQGGSGPGADASGYVYFISSNGTFDADIGRPDFGDTFTKLHPTTGQVVDYFTPYDQYTMDVGNHDLGSGGSMLLPDQPGPHPHLIVGAGKTGTLYIVDRDNMGHFHSGNDSQIVQSLIGIFPNLGNFTSPVYFQTAAGARYVYFGPVRDTIQAFQLANGLLPTAPTFKTVAKYDFPGAAIALSANGGSNGILWAVERPGGYTTSLPGVLHAYDATNLATELYSATLGDVAVKFGIPAVANGKVFVGTEGPRLLVFGLLP